MTAEPGRHHPAAEPTRDPHASVPVTALRPVVDTYHGVAVHDDYRWLEDAGDPEVRAWSGAQNAAARAYLDALPGLPILRERVRRLIGDSPRFFPTHAAGGTLFVLKHQPPLQQRLIVAFIDPDDPTTERVVLDPNALDPSGMTAIDWYVPSPDGRLVAVSLSKAGSEAGTLHLIEVASGREIDEPIPRVQYGTGGGSVAWLEGSRSLLYTRYPHLGERPDHDLNFYQQVWVHVVGTPISQDAYAIGREFPRIAEVALQSTDDGRWACARVAHGDGGDYEWWLRAPGGEWSQLAAVADRIVGGMFGRDDAIWLRTLRDAPRGAILRIPLDAPRLGAARMVLPEGPDAILDWTVTAGHLYVVFTIGGPTELRAFDLDGNPVAAAPTPPVSTVLSPLRLDGDEVLFGSVSHVQPERYLRWTAGAGEARPTALRSTSPADFSDTEVSRISATAKDGTRIPMTVLRRRGTALDGRNPTLLYGYGGYGLILAPRFDPSLRAWIEQGGVYVEANLRGGGEFGDEWHRAGNLTRKQTVFDDFIACAEHLIAVGYAAPATLAAEGRSNGGLLVGAVLTQRPELFRAVVASVGVLDALRSEVEDNGAFNVTEFGTTADPEQFAALYAYSPFHRVVDGTAYPAVLLTTGANDPRVNPFHSRKMAARLQAATSSPYPVLLRTSDKAGHGMGSSIDERVAERADVIAFLCDQLGVEVRPVE